MWPFQGGQKERGTAANDATTPITRAYSKTSGKATAAEDRTQREFVGASVHYNSASLTSSPSLTSKPTTSSEKSPATASPLAKTTWDKALLHTCLEKGSLAATPHQVLEHKSSLQTLPSVDDVAEYEASSIARQIKPHSSPPVEATATPSSSALRASVSVASSLLWSAPRALYSGVSRTVDYLVSFGDDYDLDNIAHEWVEMDDEDASSAGGKGAAPEVDWKTPVVSIELVRDCIDFLLEQLELHTNEHVVVLLRHASKSHAPVPTSWPAWCRQAACNEESITTAGASIATFLKRLSLSDVDMLACVLVELGHAEMTKDNLLLLPKRNSTPLSDAQRQYHVTTFQLQQAISVEERRVQQWTASMEKCTRAATLANKKGDRKTAIGYLSQRKKLAKHVEQAHGKLLNLHQAQLALEGAHTGETVQALKATSDTLKQLRLHTPDVDLVVDDLQDELDQVPVLPTAVTGLAAEDLDDDELLAELNQLCLEDLPDVPTHDPRNRKSVSDKEKDRLSVEST